MSQSLAPLGNLQPAPVSPKRSVPEHIARPEYVGKPGPSPFTGSEVNPPEVIERIRAASKLAAQALEHIGTHIAAGVTTDELDVLAHDYLIERGAYPSTLGYRGFPKSICTSINEVICHGIPDARPLEEGDIVNVDITAYLDGVHGDTNATFAVGQIDEQSAALMEHTKAALERGIKAVKPGRQVNIIGRVIEAYARRHGYGVVREYTGHGVGVAFHSGLIIPHYDSAPAHAESIEPGMVFTIEPMLTIGEPDSEVWADDWTVVTKDRTRSAQYEHTILVTDRGAEILTLP